MSTSHSEYTYESCICGHPIEYHLQLAGSDSDSRGECTAFWSRAVLKNEGLSGIDIEFEADECRCKKFKRPRQVRLN